MELNRQVTEYFNEFLALITIATVCKAQIDIPSVLQNICPYAIVFLQIELGFLTFPIVIVTYQTLSLHSATTSFAFCKHSGI